MINYIFDGVLILILLIGALIGLKKGFIATVAKPVKVIASLVIAFSTSSLVSDAFVKGWLYNPISGKLSSYLTEKCADISAASASEELPTLIKLVAKMFGIDVDSVAAGGESGEAVINSIVEAVTDPVVTVISVVLSFIAIYIVLRIVLWLILLMVDKTVDYGFVGAINKILGCICTLAITVLIVWALCGISESVLSIQSVSEQPWVQEFTGGYVYNFFKKMSPIDFLLSF